MKKIISSLLVIAVCFLLIGCTKKENGIVGKWETKLGTYSYVYTFNEDKTCTYDAAGTLMKCTYEIKDDTISILYDGNTAPFETTFSIEGNKLNVKDSLGNDTIYTRK